MVGRDGAHLAQESNSIYIHHQTTKSIFYHRRLYRQCVNTGSSGTISTTIMLEQKPLYKLTIMFSRSTSL
jgi:hypothetical protein